MTSYNAATLGKQPLTNTNTKTLSSPVSGATFTWTDLSIPYTIVAASPNARAASGSSSSGRVTTSSAGAAATTSAATGASGTGSSAASSPTTSKSGAERSSGPQVLISLAATIVVFLHMSY